MKVQMRCLVCQAEAVVDILAEKHGELEVVPVSDYYCAQCKILVDVIIDGAAEKENGKN